jgi:hypothetical protein
MSDEITVQTAPDIAAELQERRQLALDLGADLQTFEMDAEAFAEERKRLGGYGADAEAIIVLAERQLQLVQLLRRSIYVIRK